MPRRPLIDLAAGFGIGGLGAAGAILFGQGQWLLAAVFWMLAAGLAVLAVLTVT